MSSAVGLARAFYAIVPALVGSGCHAVQANADELSSAERMLGVYRFTEQITASSGQSESIDLDGAFVVLGDTVTVEARPGPCRYDPRSTRAGPIVYGCGDQVTLLFDRQQPVLRSTYSAQVKIRETTRVCVRYVVDASGRRTCAEMSTQTTERTITQTGHLRVQRTQGQPPPS